MPPSKPNQILNEQWLMRAAWWVAHKKQIQNGFMATVFVVSIAAILYSAYGFFDYYVLSRDRDQQIFNQLSQNLVNFSTMKVPQPIGISSVVLSQSRSTDHFDVLAKVVNSNDKWTADVTVNFPSADEPDGVDQHITLLNKDEQFLIGAGLAASSNTEATATVKNVAWHRVKNLDALNSRKPTLAITDVHFTSSAEVKIPGDFNVGQVTFAITNQSIFNFWSVDLTVVLMDRDTPIAAAKTTLNKLLTNEKRQVSLNFYTNIPAATNVLVVPYVNISDDSVFMKIPGKSLQAH